MAAILRSPEGSSKGIVTFTTQERDHLIRRSGEMQMVVRALKERWVLGLHHNWHDYTYEPDPLFDFDMAGEGDLITRDGAPIQRVPFDACNFVPDVFAPNAGPRFWDVLYVARAVNFKNIPEFFGAIRRLYDAGHKLRVLFICPVPPFVKSDVGSAIYDIREKYDAMFTSEERDLFTLMTLEFGYPFPFDLPTLAHFYASSRVFVHSAADERRCRVAAYAWASGIPVVAMSSVGSLLPERLRRPPLYYEARSYDEFPARILEALSAVTDSASVEEVRGVLGEGAAVPQFRSSLEAIAEHADIARYALENLSLRLGRHHERGLGRNRVEQSFADFLGFISKSADSMLLEAVGSPDPEIAIASRPGGRWVAPMVARSGPSFVATLMRPFRFLRRAGRGR